MARYVTMGSEVFLQYTAANVGYKLYSASLTECQGKEAALFSEVCLPLGCFRRAAAPARPYLLLTRPPVAHWIQNKAGQGAPTSRARAPTRIYNPDPHTYDRPK